MRPIHDRPCAARGLISYRYPNRYGGWVMIGAENDAHALVEARRSTGEPARAELLEVWSSGEGRYLPVR